MSAWFYVSLGLYACGVLLILVFAEEAGYSRWTRRLVLVTVAWPITIVVGTAVGTYQKMFDKPDGDIR